MEEYLIRVAPGSPPGIGIEVVFSINGMTYKRLSESEKQEIIRLFQAGKETIANLTERFGVSSSTIRRAVKGITPESEAATLPDYGGGPSGAGSAGTVVELQAVLDSPVALDVASEPAIADSTGEEIVSNRPQKRPAARPTPPPAATPVVETPPVVYGPRDKETSRSPAGTFRDRRGKAIGASPSALPEQNQNRRTTRRRSSAPLSVPPASPEFISLATPVLEPQSKDPLDEYLPTRKPDPATQSSQDLVAELATLERGDLEEEGLEDDLDDLDDLDADFEDEEEGGTDNGDLSLLVGSQIQPDMLVQVQPIATAQLPKTCYLVIDRASELITRPLKDFGDLGAFPDIETQQRTLPVFDNHQVAKRFSNPRTQRVIKLPDARMLQNTSSHLHAKGITRLLIDGRVYSL